MYLASAYPGNNVCDLAQNVGSFEADGIAQAFNVELKGLPSSSCRRTRAVAFRVALSLLARVGSDKQVRLRSLLTFQ